MDSKRVLSTREIVITALMIALVFLAGSVIKIPTIGGFVHIGDAFIYLAAALLPTPYAMVCAAIGAGLADFATGYAIWVIPTMIIKPILVLFITSIYILLQNILQV